MGKILLQPLAQESTAEPCDVGDDINVIKAEFGELVDASITPQDWFMKEGVQATTPDALEERARQFRCWLHERPERDIAVVGHGGFWDYVTDKLGDDGCLLGMALLFCTFSI